MIRTSLTATHTAEQIDRAIEVLTKVGKELAVIPA
jgi:7-keto-8-aminopelargonate synthetase-like enzyme